MWPYYKLFSFFKCCFQTIVKTASKCDLELTPEVSHPSQPKKDGGLIVRCCSSSQSCVFCLWLWISFRQSALPLSHSHSFLRSLWLIKFFKMDSEKRWLTMNYLNMMGGGGGELKQSIMDVTQSFPLLCLDVDIGYVHWTSKEGHLFRNKGLLSNCKASCAL